MQYRYRSYQGTNLNPIWILIAVNLLMYLATLIARNFLFSLFGLWSDFFWTQPWTIVTNLFIHAGFRHIFGNMLTLFFFGSNLSGLVGNKQFLLIYFGGGILGNILLLLLAPLFPFSVAVGASGAVFAVAGTLTVLAPKSRVFIFPIPVPIPLWIAVIGGFVLLSFLPFVAWQAHLGGLIFGLVAGLLFKRRQRAYYTIR